MSYIENNYDATLNLKYKFLHSMRTRELGAKILNAFQDLATTVLSINLFQSVEIYQRGILNPKKLVSVKNKQIVENISADRA